MVLARDITEIRKDAFKGRAFRKDHIILAEDIACLRRLDKERLFALSLRPDELQEDDAGGFAFTGTRSVSSGIYPPHI